jgi:diguanylate cyclase (GGDEF)-like protein
LGIVMSPFASGDEPPSGRNTAELLRHADFIKTSDHPAFLKLLSELSEKHTESPRESSYLRYLKAWELAYEGDYTAAVPELNAVIDSSGDVTLRHRAGVTAINSLAAASRYDEAYSRLSELLGSLPEDPDNEARLLGLGVAALLYNQAGQYDLAATYADKWIAADPNGPGACKGSYIKLEALQKASKALDEAKFQDGVATCSRFHESVYANLIRTFEANFDLERGNTSAAIKLLNDNYDEAQRTSYRRLTSEVDSILARAYWKQSDTENAKRYAQSAVDKAVKNEITKPLADAYSVLFEVAKQQKDFENAVAYHEKYATADKGYLNDTSARALAYQMVNQQVLAKKREVDALSEKNQMLQLQQKVDAKTLEAGRLYLALLATLLAFLAFWGYKTKRSQVRFRTLARRDGLTGIFNRQHFIDAAETVLKYGGKSAREACLVLIDLDHFKQVNDVHGHATGDVVLKRAVAACQSHLRSIDIFGRLGGEEFGVLLPDCALETAQRRAEDLRAAVAGVSDAQAGIDFPVSASFGVAAATPSGFDLRQMLIDADTALYDAKRSGRNRVAVHRGAATTTAAAANA